nr:hypothetical protein [uncultured bacterium]
MIRKLSASTFLALISIILIFQHPALGICECSREFYLSDCACSAPEEDQCTCCQAAEFTGHPRSSPCQNCCKRITCDPGEILWNPLADLDPWEGIEIPSLELPCFFNHPVKPDQGFARPSSRPPPDGLPRFLRFNVIRK